MSLAVDLGNSYQVSKIEIHPQAAAYRDLAGRIDVLTSENNEKSGWTLVSRDDWVLEQISDDWFTIYFRVPVEGRYIKVHNYYDDRDYTNEALWELSTIKREAENSQDTSDFFKVYYMEPDKYETYFYDKNGNRISLTEELGDAVSETEYSYIQVQSGINTDRLSDAGPLHFEYDDNGNMISKYNSETDESFEYHYDVLNRLVSVQKGDTIIVSYLYSHQGYRVKTMSIEHGTIYYTFDETGFLLFEETTDLNTDYIYLSGQHLAKNEYEPGDKTNQERYFYLTDHLGSTICLTDSTGKILWQDDYTPFGETTGDTGTKHDTGMYTGKQLDPDTGLYYSNARWYDADLGRFITEDPIKDGLNWFVYCANNPMNRVDPSGLAPLQEYLIQLALYDFSLEKYLNDVRWPKPQECKANAHSTAATIKAVKYNGFKWDTLVPYNPAAFDYVQNQTPVGSFFSLSNPDSEDISLPDGEDIDAYHLFATLSYYSTPMTEGIPFVPQEYGGWIGDLQTGVNDYLQRLGQWAPKNVPGEIVGNPNPNASSFSEKDILTDIDAHNINYYILGNNKDITLWEALDEYYGGGMYEKRYSLFVESYDGIDKLREKARNYAKGLLTEKQWDPIEGRMRKPYKNEANTIADEFIDYISNGVASETP
ncbi:MAG: RHS domain-containing protein [Acidobacteria bacterium]|nr:RHS domain-containing protein [Acidobacteriota bacterium]